MIKKALRKAVAVVTAIAVIMTVSGSLVLAEGIPEAHAGERTIKNLLAIAFEPFGSLLYVWGGGHTPKGEANVDATTIGLGSYWKAFYDSHGSDYDYDKFRYKYRDGLDCSGYVGWTLYNIFNSSSGKDGYVMKSTVMAKSFANRGWGEYVPASKIRALHAGDIMSTDGHVFIGVGDCPDGSRVLVHCSPPAAQITGTLAPGSPEAPKTDESGNPLTEEQIKELTPESDSEAIRLANYYMNKYWPGHHAKFPEHSRGKNYLTEYNQMVWYEGKTVSDPDGLQSMDAYHVLKTLFDDEGLIMSMPAREIIIDGEKIENSRRRYPILMYNDIIYIPLTWNDSHFMGLNLSNTEKGLTLSRAEKTELKEDNGLGPAFIGNECDDIIFEETALYGDGYPTLMCGDMVYMPLTWNITAALGWTSETTEDAFIIKTQAEADLPVIGYTTTTE